MTMTLSERILSRSEMDPNSGCWLWSAWLDKYGYGGLRFKDRRLFAHRASYEAFVGCPKGMHVLHRCDTPCCVNPAHLFLGTHKDNMVDMQQKGRAGWQKAKAKGHDQ